MKSKKKVDCSIADGIIGESGNISVDMAWLFDHRFEPIAFVDGNNALINAQLDCGYDTVDLYGFGRDFQIGKTEFRVVATTQFWNDDKGKKTWMALLPLDWEFGNMFDIVLMKEDGIDMTEHYDVDGITKIFETAFEKYGGERVEFGEASLVQFEKDTAEEAVRYAVACAAEICNQLSAMKLKLKPMPDKVRWVGREIRKIKPLKCDNQEIKEAKNEQH